VDGEELAQEVHSALSIFSKKSMLMPFKVDDPEGTPGNGILDARITMDWDYGCKGGDPSWKYTMRITDKTSVMDREVEIPACWTKLSKDVQPQPEYKEVLQLPIRPVTPPATPPRVIPNSESDVTDDGDTMRRYDERYGHLLKREGTPLRKRPSFTQWVGLDVRTTEYGHLVTCCDRIERLPPEVDVNPVTPIVSITPELCSVPANATVPRNEPIFAIRDASRDMALPPPPVEYYNQV
jgi:hypothetical protein